MCGEIGKNENYFVSNQNATNNNVSNSNKPNSNESNKNIIDFEKTNSNQNNIMDCKNETFCENLINGCEKTIPYENCIEASVALQVLPWVEMGKVNDIVDKVIEYIKSTGVRHVVGPFETTMEGDLDFLMEIVKKSQRIVIEAGAPEVISMVKIAFRPDSIGSATIESKIGKYKLPND